MTIQRSLINQTVVLACILLFTACGGSDRPSDTIAPDVPIIISPDHDAVINENNPDVNGTAEADSTVELFDTNGITSLGTATATGGNWSITSGTLADGTHSLTAKATDAAGNTSSASTAISITVDTTAPNAPVIISPVDDAVISDNTPTVSGTAEADSTVELFDTNGITSLGTAAATGGNWSITVSMLGDGIYTLTTKATDAVDNISSVSTAISITVDTILPTFTFSSPPSSATGIAVNSSVSAVFSEALAASTVAGNSFTLVKASDSSSVTGTLATTTGDTVATFTPSGDFEYGTQYTATLTTAITDVAGNAFAGTSWSFTTVELPTVDAFFSALPNWNDYVKTLDTNTACDGTETGGYLACIHAGEVRSVVVPGYSSCTGLTAIDALGAFDWSCQVINSQAYMVSNGLKNIASVEGAADDTVTGQLLDSTATFVTDGIEAGDAVINTTDYTNSTVVSVDSETQLTLADDIFISTESYSINRDKYLSDLIDFATPGWKNNSVTVLDNITTLFTTASSVWWANPVAIANTGGNLPLGGTVYLVTTDPNSDYTLAANKISLVVKPGVTLTGGGSTNIGADSIDFIWLEGKLEASGQTEGVLLEFIKFSVLRGVEVNNADYNIWLSDSSSNLLKNVIANNNTYVGMTNGIYMNRADDNTLDNVITAGNPDGISLGDSSNNSLTNIATVNNSRYGIWFHSSSNNNSLSSVIASYNGESGIYLAASLNNTLSDFSANNNVSYGVRLDGAADNNNLSDFIAENNNLGVFLNASSNNNLSNFSVANSGDTGIQLNNSSFNTLSDVASLNNPDTGISISSSTDNTLTNITSSNNGYAGFYIIASSNHQLSNITAANNTNYGLYLDTSSNNSLSNLDFSGNSEGLVLEAATNNELSDIIAANNEGGIGFYGSSNNNNLSNLTVSNNDLGIYLLESSSNNKLLNVTAFNNAENGVEFNSFTQNNSLSNVTSANNGNIGVYLTNSSNNSLSNITSVNNYHGIMIASSSDNSLSNITSSDNEDRGISSGNSSDNYFTGLLKIGNNGNDCVVSGGTDPGLVHLTCANNGSSDATLTTGITLASSFVGKLTIDDTINTSDAGSSVAFPADSTTFDWTAFENSYRGWGVDGAFPGADSRGLWWEGMGSIWDWSADINDTLIKDVLTIADGDATITHTWSDLSSTIYLRNTTEIVGDSIGNDNGLCETDETCLYTPNIGSYQGHGVLQSAGTFTDGDITGVTIMEYSINGAGE